MELFVNAMSYSTVFWFSMYKNHALRRMFKTLGLQIKCIINDYCILFFFNFSNIVNESNYGICLITKFILKFRFEGYI